MYVIQSVRRKRDDAWSDRENVSRVERTSTTMPWNPLLVEYQKLVVLKMKPWPMENSSIVLSLLGESNAGGRIAMSIISCDRSR